MPSARLPRSPVLRSAPPAACSLQEAPRRVLRGGAPEAGSRLAEAQTVLEGQLDEVRSRREIARAAGAQRVGAFVSYADARRELVTRQLAIEAWLADWHRAAAAAA